MRWNQKLQAIIDYVEHHLQCRQEPVDILEIEHAAGCSYSFFQKVFSYTTGISFAEYIRFRKMTLAGYALKSSRIKVIDLSYQFGYDSPTSFTRAFQQFHGLTPKEARSPQAQLRIFPKMQIFADHQYSWEIQQKPEIRLIGKSIRISQDGGQHFTAIPGFWNECQRDGTFSKLISLDEGSAKGMFGLFDDYNETTKEIQYSIMTASKCPLPEGFIEKRIPQASWAVFDCRGSVPGAIQKGWKYLNEEWLVKYPFKHGNCPELEWYSDENPYAEDYLSQIWIPIIEEE